MNNRLDNAIRYSLQGGRVTVRVTAHPTRDAVSDDGPVIPVEERQRVFERFHRLLGKRADGSGHGHAIVQEIALTEDAGGLGNTFTVTFPETGIRDQGSVKPQPSRGSLIPDP